MGRYRFALFFSIATLLAFVPHLTFAASFFGPVIPQSGSCFCDGGPLDWGCVLQVLQNLIKLAVSLGVFACVFWVAIAGFSLIASRGNPQSISTAKARILNAVVGIAVILSSWLIVDFVMKALYNQQNFGPWNAILAGNGNDFCILPTDPIFISGGPLQNVSPSTGTTGSNTGGGGGGGSYGGSGKQCNVNSQACSVTALQRVGFSETQANVMSCIAMTESSGVPGTPPYNQTHPGSNSTACGTFQITQTTWNKNASGSCKNFSSCTNAACNAQVALSLVRQNGYSDWTCPGCNNKAQACITRYSK